MAPLPAVEEGQLHPYFTRATIQMANDNSEDVDESLKTVMNIPLWGWYTFGGCIFVIILLLFLDYLLIRRNALGNNSFCMSFVSRRKYYTSASTGANQMDSSSCGGGAQSAGLFHYKRSTNMILSV